MKDVTTMRKIVDVILTIDSLELDDNETVEDVVKLINDHFWVGYDIQYEVTYEETVDD